MTITVGVSSSLVGVDSAQLGLTGESTTDLDGQLSDCWFEIREENTTTWTTVGEGQGLWTGTLLTYTHSETGLDPDTTYEFRGYILQGGETYQSGIETFTTDPEPVGTTVSTLSPDNIGENEARLRLSYASDYDGEVYFEWRRDGETVWNVTPGQSVDAGTSEVRTHEITALSPGTTYQFRGILEADTTYTGSTVEFDTLEVVGHVKKHGLGDSDNHLKATLQDLNDRIEGANLDDKDDERDPKDHDVIDKHTTTQTDTGKVLRPDGVDGVVWGDAPSNGGFDIRSDDPAEPTEGDVWYNSTDKQFKGYNGTEVVILG